MNVVQHALVLAVRAYQRLVSPALVALFGHACRFAPSCSAYAIEAVRRHGALRGAWLATARLARCHPWGGCGHDPVPETAPPRAARVSRVAGAMLPR